MIGIDVDATGLKLRSTVSDGACTYLDADWIAPDAGRAAALAVAPGDDSDHRAGQALLAVALRAAGVVDGLPANRVEVTGSGFVAGAVRRLVGSPSMPSAESRPLAIVDATGDPQEVLQATRRLDDLGVLVLAGESAGRAIDLDLYPDVHVRGLRIVGVAPASVDAVPEAIPEAALAHLAAEPPARVREGEPLPHAGWYRIG
jgi:hypothetical protein